VWSCRRTDGVNSGTRPDIDELGQVRGGYDNLARIDSIKPHGESGGNAVGDKYVDFAFDLAGQPEAIDLYADLTGDDMVAATDNTFDQAGRLTGHHRPPPRCLEEDIMTSQHMQLMGITVAAVIFVASGNLPAKERPPFESLHQETANPIRWEGSPGPLAKLFNEERDRLGEEFDKALIEFCGSSYERHLNCALFLSLPEHLLSFAKVM